jgi:TRAP-type mannitol/chloroaromatic compound transport system substrate-binding protein
MERRKFLAGSGTVGVGVAAAALMAACGKKEEPAKAEPAKADAAKAGAPAVATGEVRWRLASSFPKSFDTLFGAAETFAKTVATASGGKFTVSAHAAGELVPPFGVVDAVQNGTVECAHTAPYYFFGKDETFSLDCAIPFGLNARQMAAWMHDGNGMKLLREFYTRYNIVNFPMGNTGAQMGGWYRKEIRSVADMKGLKMRISNLAGAVCTRMGVVPQTLPGGEIYTALEKGTIDAAEWVGPYDDLRLGIHKVAPNYYYPGWWEGGPQLSLYVNSKSYEALSAENKAIVQAAATYAGVDLQAKYDARNPGALKQLVAEGAKLHRFPKDVMDAAFKISNEVYAEISAKNATWKKVYDDYTAFRRDQNLWFRFAEGSFDNYMQSLKL